MMVWVEEVAKTTIFGDGITAEDMVRNSFKKFIARSSKTMISSLSVYAQTFALSLCSCLSKGLRVLFQVHIIQDSGQSRNVTSK